MLTAQAWAAGLIVNEASNGTSGTKEFYEFIVVGDAASPTASVNLDGWILDDNNGEWEGSTSGVGIAPGYARFDASSDLANCAGLSAIAPGSIIVVYNDSDPNSNLPADDANDANGDGVYILQARGSCIKTCAGPPSTASAAYSSCTVVATPSYAPLALRNTGDVAQSRAADGSLFHGFTYGDITTPYPTGSFRIGSSSGSATSFVFACGNWQDESNFSRVSASVDTPGAPNNAANVIFRQKISAGQFNYLDPADNDNCSASPSLAVQKLSSIVSDPVNGGSNPKAIPGAIVEYCILISNTGSATADMVTTTDTLPVDISYAVGTMLSGPDCETASIPEDDNDSGADENDPWGASISGSTITMVVASLAPTSSIALTFQVAIE
ncbi:MAG: hypothetical protein ABJO01_12710 [Parasphingorhabdus sp.]|uniref:hypothetical protein n=1 Tax=Parasphingorhabdus sp. TaxID=2709688 RepID=UPI003298C16F